jgi:hypothetical protein
MAFVSTPLRPALSGALILLTGDDWDQKQTAEQKSAQTASRAANGAKH